MVAPPDPVPQALSPEHGRAVHAEPSLEARIRLILMLITETLLRSPRNTAGLINSYRCIPAGTAV
jgi:hypothetical protein